MEYTEFQPVLNGTGKENWTAFVDRELRIVSTNDYCRTLFGWDPQQTQGRKLGDLINLAPLTSLVVAGFCFRSESVTTHGKRLVCSYVPILEDGKSLGGVLSIAEDDSPATRESTAGRGGLAQSLGPLMDIVQDGLLVVDRDGFITLVNQHFADAMGARAQDMIGKHILKAYTNSKTSRLPIVMETGKAEIGWPHLINGREVVACRYPLFKDGEVIGALGRILFRDVREVTLLANQLNTLMKKESGPTPSLSKHCDFNYDVNSIVGSSKMMRELKEKLLRVAKRGSSVLLIGESGTGKELLAHSIHAASPRRYGPFIKVNCAAIPEHLLESELFGYADGAFTGAKKGGQIGKFELADGGTLFLDEISDMSVTMQAKLLRVLQEKEVTPLGSDTTRKFDVRVLAATNVNMKRLVEEGKFRHDLYYRLNIVSVVVPPLRQRVEDIFVIVEHFIDTFNVEFGLKVKGLTPEAWDVLKRYDFPGNIRELRNVIESAFNVVQGSLIRRGDLPDHLLQASTTMPDSPKDILASSGIELVSDNLPLPKILERVEKYLIEEAIDRAGGSKNDAAALLGISRPGIYKKLQKYQQD
ncbi:MAG: PAS domain-containing protein [Desulfuromonadales bacterium]|nr:PAS domain-containing protein [Desulfuromonadales bacterium]NIS39197.1 PAS domain-containing protein [Desulfuromonadales bacterium]